MTAQEAQELIRKGVAQLGQGDFAGARDTFTQVAAAERGEAASCLGLAFAHASLQDLPAAHAALDQALTYEPKNVRALMVKGDLLDAENQIRSAAAFYTAALNAAPARNSLPMEMQKDLQRAEANLERYAGEYEQHLKTRLAQVEADASPRFIQSVDMLFGTRSIYRQEPRFYYFPELAPIQYFPREQFPWLDEVEAATAAIKAEAMAVLDDEGAFEPYIQNDPRKPSTSKGGMLNNRDWSAFYLVKDGVPVAENIARCPRTMEALKNAPISTIRGCSPSILFSLLRPGAHIPAHTGVTNTRLICHLPLIVPGKCALRVGNELREWEEGKAWVFDDTIEHEAWNKSDQPRVILLFETWRPELSEAERAYVSALFEAVYDHGGGPTDWSI